MSVVRVIPPTPEPKWIPISQMRPGQFATTANGKIYYRTVATAACLTHPLETYQYADTAHHVQVEILPPGTKIEIEVAE